MIETLIVIINKAMIVNNNFYQLIENYKWNEKSNFSSINNVYLKSLHSLYFTY